MVRFAMWLPTSRLLFEMLELKARAAARPPRPNTAITINTSTSSAPRVSLRSCRRPCASSPATLRPLGRLAAPLLRTTPPGLRSARAALTPCALVARGHAGLGQRRGPAQVIAWPLCAPPRRIPSRDSLGSTAVVGSPVA